MKIQCDVCSKKEACVFCTADEAALCEECDKRVHDANKLASKHQRFSLLLPSSSHSPLCDICQDKRALLFCQQDRAILCKDCDIPLHSTNEYTKKHNRFLLTGVKLSTIISNNSTKKVNNSISNNNGVELCDPVPDFKAPQKHTSNFSERTPNTINSALSVVDNCSTSINAVNSANNQMINAGLTSNISEYLIDMLPGWHFEDLLVDSASPTPFGFCKSGNNHDIEVNEDVLSCFDVEIDKEMTCSSTQCENFWVPQATPIAGNISNFLGQSSEFEHNKGGFGLVHGSTKEKLHEKEASVSTIKLNRKYLKDDTFTVPQITSYVGSKRARHYW